MQLYIMRHGIAVESSHWPGDDATRPLTPEGRTRVEDIVKSLKKDRKLQVDAIWSSPLMRALETAQLAGKVLQVDVQTTGALTCGADLKSLLRAFRGLDLPGKIMLVGHQPDCGLMIGDFIGDPSSDYALKKSGVACLEGKLKAGGMALKWILSPKDVLD
jgi:phosphohistidine phosphatase